MSQVVIQDGTTRIELHMEKFDATSMVKVFERVLVAAGVLPAGSSLVVMLPNPPRAHE